ncbi:hypothetical protein KIK84_13245 [Curvibacter sp. CHRR-16]|uniref:hypothetical protein n=1 Tax=Curvibacter sp. CHRR-16 TaxID=2835872 RepID=UPI001BDADB21|nr:hypothetical protein [Curvibacter sp. CHRR-16]MBT0571294.1 hypothetical protein [Curvibacter sp. CHRR-16]
MQLPLAPSHEEIVTKFNVEILKSPGDLVLRNGDIAVTKSGDLMLNNEHYSAMRRFVSAWRFNAPMLKSLFDLTMVVSSRSQDLKRSLDQGVDYRRDPSQKPFPPGSTSFKRRFALTEEIAANMLGSESCAGAILLNLTGFLQALKDDINAGRLDWEGTAPLIHGHSVGVILVATSNYFRHWDEWRKTSPPTTRQATSMDVLNAVLHSAGLKQRNHRLMGVEGICTKILDVLSDGDFEILSERVFAFANGLKPGP